MKEEIINIDNKKIHLVNTNKFKSNNININLGTKYSRKDYTYLLFLKTILLYSTNNYPSYRELRIAKEELYNASLGSNISIFKDYQILNISIGSLNDKYSEKGNTEGLFNLLHEIIFNPFVKDNAFDKDTFDIVKGMLINNINNYQEDKEEYARVRMLEEYNYNSPLSNRDCGYYEELINITPSSLYEYYKYILNNSMIDIYVVGDINSKDIYELVNKYLDIKGIESNYNTLYKEEINDYNEIIEEDNITQSKLILGVRLDEDDNYGKLYSFQLYSIMLGGGVDSKFFKNIREKHSACYYASSRAMRANNVMVIRSGIDYKNYNLVIDLMKKEMNDMKDGNFQDNDLEVAKTLIKSNMEGIYDNPNSIISNLITNNLYGISSNNEYLNNINKVTREDIIKIANKVRINTIYLLKEGTNED